MKGAKAEIIEKPDYTLFETGLNNPMWNQVILKSLNLEKISLQIEEIKSHFEQKGLQFTWFTGPKTQSSVLNKRALDIFLLQIACVCIPNSYPHFILIQVDQDG
jgi:hypothetical protein